MVGRDKYLLTMHTALVLRGDLKTAHTMESETTTVLWITMRMLVSSATQVYPCALTLSTWLVASVVGADPVFFRGIVTCRELLHVVSLKSNKEQDCKIGSFIS